MTRRTDMTGELICLGSSRSSFLQLCVIFAANLVKILKTYLFPPKKVTSFQLQSNSVISRYTGPIQKFKISDRVNSIRYICQMWMRNIVV